METFITPHFGFTNEVCTVGVKKGDIFVPFHSVQTTSHRSF